MSDVNKLRCVKCGNESMELTTNTSTKSKIAKLGEWLKCCNDNVLLKLSHREKYSKEMPIYIENEWVCSECGEKHADFKEVADKFKRFERIDITILVVWIAYIITLVFVWFFQFEREGLFVLFALQLLGLVAVCSVRYGLRMTIQQLQYDLVKYKGSCKANKRVLL